MDIIGPKSPADKLLICEVYAPAETGRVIHRTNTMCNPSSEVGLDETSSSINRQDALSIALGNLVPSTTATIRSLWSPRTPSTTQMCHAGSAGFYGGQGRLGCTHLRKELLKRDPGVSPVRR